MQALAARARPIHCANAARYLEIITCMNDPSRTATAFAPRNLHLRTLAAPARSTSGASAVLNARPIRRTPCGASRKKQKSRHGPRQYPLALRNIALVAHIGGVPRLGPAEAADDAIALAIGFAHGTRNVEECVLHLHTVPVEVAMLVQPRARSLSAGLPLGAPASGDTYFLVARSAPASPMRAQLNFPRSLHNAALVAGTLVHLPAALPLAVQRAAAALVALMLAMTRAGVAARLDEAAPRQGIAVVALHLAMLMAGVTTHAEAMGAEAHLNDAAVHVHALHEQGLGQVQGLNLFTMCERRDTALSNGAPPRAAGVAATGFISAAGPAVSATMALGAARARSGVAGSRLFGNTGTRFANLSVGLGPMRGRAGLAAGARGADVLLGARLHEQAVELRRGSSAELAEAAGERNEILLRRPDPITHALSELCGHAGLDHYDGRDLLRARSQARETLEEPAEL
mmetsp:Transcript_83171/g.240296  ORF Transcript_83171/g.240296 Transcript_83171/m.240296 type:complete len:459 (-) Transcript_83171:837-2213(-)